MSWMVSREVRALLAKLVIGVSTVVALADSAQPQWYSGAEAQAHLQVVFAEQDERKAIFSIELGGPLYADLLDGEVQISATADRTASDLALSVRPFDPSSDEAAPDEPAGEAEVARATPSRPNVAMLSVPVGCPEEDPAVPRPERCSEQFEITLTRGSDRPLSIDLNAVVQLQGRSQTQPKGTFEFHLEELDP
jgi:hypothetical protein